MARPRNRNSCGGSGGYDEGTRRPRMLYLSAADIAAALPMPEAIEAMRRAFVALSRGETISPPRLALGHKAHGAVTLTMPGATADACAVKVVSVHPRNRGEGRPTVQALVILLDPATGENLAILEGTALTALRTGAASGLATALLARPDARTAAFFGAGAQSRTQLAAVRAVRRLERVWIVDRTYAKAEAFAASLPADCRASAARTAAEALREADIVCAATTSTTPVFSGADLAAGCHVNAVGSFTPEMREIGPDTFARVDKLVVDTREAAWLEGGIPASEIHAELGEIAGGERAGRESAQELTLFKSVGNAIQDVVAAAAVYRVARERGLGLTLPSGGE